MHCSPLDASAPAPLRVGLLGIGVVGSGVQRLLARNHALIAQRAGRTIELRRVAARHVARARELVGAHTTVVGDAMAVATDPDIDVVVEVIGGCTVARELVLAAIAHGKHVVTANKALLALHGEEIFAAAERRGVVVAFEGAVAVSIPIVKALREGLAANEVTWLAGVVNGTSNFVLTQMRERGVSFGVALAEAQRLGYAEADPGLDVDGGDSAHKLALLASLAFGTPLAFDAIEVTGIRALSLVELVAAERLGFRVKLLASARRHGAKLDMRVEPALVPTASLMAGVNGSLNGIVVHGDASGPTTYCGAGAGSLETASAVVADLIELARAVQAPVHGRAPALGVARAQAKALPRMASQALVSPHYLRVSLPMDDVLRLLAVGNLSMAAHADLGDDGVALITQSAPRSAIREVIGLLEREAGIRAPVVWLPVESLR